MNLTFIYPNYLFFLFLIPVMVFLHWVTLRTRRKRAIKFANFDAVARIKGIDIYSRNITSLAMTLITLLVLIFAVAGITLQYEARTSSVAFVIAIDNSRSMEANDMLPTRLEAAKKNALSFVNSLPLGTSVGVISFSGNAVIEQKVTNDPSLIERAISRLDFSPVGGTDLNEAVIASADLLKKYPQKSVILISDGQTNVGSIEDAIEYAKIREIKVHTIGVGTGEGGETTYGMSKIDENSLKSLAYNTGGMFFYANQENELFLSLQKIAEIKQGNVSLSLVNYLLFFALILVAVKYLLINARLMEFP